MKPTFLDGFVFGSVATMCCVFGISRLGTGAHAQEPAEAPEPQMQVQMEKVQVIQAEAEAIADDFAILKAYLTDERLVKDGHGPYGWVQPSLEVYEAELGLRPSMMPFEHYMQLVVDEKVPFDDGDRYIAWKAEQAALE